MVVKKSAQCHGMHFLCQWGVTFAKPNRPLCRQLRRFWPQTEQESQKVGASNNLKPA
jgi:hypothetical protein